MYSIKKQPRILLPVAFQQFQSALGIPGIQHAPGSLHQHFLIRSNIGRIQRLGHQLPHDGQQMPDDEPHFKGNHRNQRQQGLQRGKGNGLRQEHKQAQRKQRQQQPYKYAPGQQKNHFQHGRGFREAGEWGHTPPEGEGTASAALLGEKGRGAFA